MEEFLRNTLNLRLLKSHFGTGLEDEGEWKARGAFHEYFLNTKRDMDQVCKVYAMTFSPILFTIVFKS